MNKRKIVITGGPSTGKTTLINYLEQAGELCLHEISRSITLEAKKQGIDQLFLEDPTLFSRKLLEGRIQQFFEAEQKKKERIFLDRGIPDIIGYMEYANQSSPSEFIEASRKYRYNEIFILPPWEEIHETDNERYESFEQATKIYENLLETYTQFGYQCIRVPFGTVKERGNFILEQVL